jgi:hypothetical protein
LFNGVNAFVAFIGMSGKKTLCKNRAKPGHVQKVCKAKKSDRELCKTVQTFGRGLADCFRPALGRGVVRAGPP